MSTISSIQKTKSKPLCLKPLVAPHKEVLIPTWALPWPQRTLPALPSLPAVGALLCHTHSFLYT